MRSWHIATVSGIKLRVHWSFLLLPVWIYYSSISGGQGSVAAMRAVMFLLAIFGCVVLHEFGHAMAARQFGIATRDITLLPIGGVAALERMPENPLKELWIAVAGPLVNVVIAACILAGLAVFVGLPALGEGNFLMQLALANIALVVFNMIPAFPMDGGRILRSLVALITDRLTATRVAVLVGRIIAVGFGLLGIYAGELILVLIAVFIYFAGSAELNQLIYASRAKARAVAGLGSIPVAEFGSGDGDPMASSVPASLPASTVLSWMSQRKSDMCVVVESGRVIGQLSRGQIVNALAAGGGHLPIGSLLR